MTFDDFKENPAVVEHLPEIMRPLDAMLTQHLVETCSGQSPDATTVAERAGASKAIANIIKLFRAAAVPTPLKKTIGLKKLHRFDRDKPPGETPSNETPSVS